jgi:hypothetical protein
MKIHVSRSKPEVIRAWAEKNGRRPEKTSKEGPSKVFSWVYTVQLWN